MPYQPRARGVQRRGMVVGGRGKEKIIEEDIFERLTVEAGQRCESSDQVYALVVL